MKVMTDCCKKWVCALIAFCLIVSMLLCFTGCGNVEYVSYVVSSSMETEYMYYSEAERESIVIGEQTYQVSYLGSEENDSGTIYHDYEVLSGEGLEIQDSILPGDKRPQITLRQDGTLVYFYGIRPFGSIGDPDSMSDDALRENTEKLLQQAVDFSKYNQFEVNLKSSRGGHITWYVERKGNRCDYEFSASYDADGYIESFSIFHDCDERFSKPFVNDRQRDQLIQSALLDKYSNGNGSRELDHFDILGYSLGRSHGNRSITYTVTAYCKDGFSDVWLVVIEKR